MKKILLLILLVQSFALIANAQDTINNKIENIFYIKYSISTPMANYLSYNDWADESLGDYKKGGAIEIGSQFYFNNLTFGNSKFGLDVTYVSVSRHTIGNLTEYEILGLEVELNPRLMFYNAGSKLGILYTYNPIDKFYVDVAAKLNPVWLNLAVEDMDSEDEPLTYYNGYMGLKYSFALNVRYDFIVLGTELNFGKLKYESNDEKGLYLGNLGESIDEKYTKSPSLNFSIGFCF